uniref:G-patch domain and KOW motifs-containing protein n=1 Tax=Pristiophorus japonicus TaxID=55135 RepID=UPI00398F20D0
MAERTRLPEDGAERGPVSFGFTRTVSKVRTTAAITDPAAEREAVSGLEQGEILSVKPRDKPRELIIPLIQKNRWHRPEPGSKVKEVVPGGEQEDSEVLSKAVQELIEESQKYQERWKEGTRDDSNLNIPLLRVNQAPDGLEDGEKVNVEMRPESSTDAEYEAVPVEAYGMAMLRGMGWKAGEGIGHTFKQCSAPPQVTIEDVLSYDTCVCRTEEGRLLEGIKQSMLETVIPKRDSDHVMVVIGRHKGQVGRILQRDKNRCRAVVQMQRGDEQVLRLDYDDICHYVGATDDD